MQEKLSGTWKTGSALRWTAGAATATAVAMLAACGGGGGGGGGDTRVAQGTLRVGLTDAPSCYEHVYVTVEKVRVHTSGGAEDDQGGWSEIVVSPARRIDLLALTNGALEDLGSTQVPAGSYTQLRLVLAANSGSNPLANAVQPVGGALVPLKTPSAQQSGLKLKADFSVAADQTTDLVADFDACKSVVVAGKSGEYILKPVVTLTPKVATGIQGYVSTTMTMGSTTVSAQQDGKVVRSTAPDATGKFVLAFLPAGKYQVVISSEARATAVIRDVPVGSTTEPVTAIGDAASAIDLPASTMSTVTGTVTAAGPASSTTLVTDATVTASQSVGPHTIHVASTPVDLDLATYTVRLPRVAAVHASYAVGALTFSTDAASAGKYTLKAAAPGRATLSKAVDVSGGDIAAGFAY